MSNDFSQFMKQREEAAGSYINGDAGPLGELAAKESPATFFSPGGGYVQTAEQVLDRYNGDARYFKAGSGEGRFEILHMGSSGDLGYWVGFQQATTKLEGNPDPVPFNLRITEIFRRENGEWKLIHRHADPLADESNKK